MWDHLNREQKKRQPIPKEKLFVLFKKPKSPGSTIMESLQPYFFIFLAKYKNMRANSRLFTLLYT